MLLAIDAGNTNIVCALVALQAVMAFAPVPPGMTPLAASALLAFLLVPWLAPRF